MLAFQSLDEKKPHCCGWLRPVWAQTKKPALGGLCRLFGCVICLRKRWNS